MTEKTNTMRAAFAEELGPMFEMWAHKDGRECLRADLIEAGPAEMADQFRKTAELLEGLGDHAEEFIGFGASRVIVDARWFAEEAADVAKRYAREEALCA